VRFIPNGVGASSFDLYAFVKVYEQAQAGHYRQDQQVQAALHADGPPLPRYLRNIR